MIVFVIFVSADRSTFTDHVKIIKWGVWNLQPMEHSLEPNVLLEGRICTEGGDEINHPKLLRSTREGLLCVEPCLLVLRRSRGSGRNANDFPLGRLRHLGGIVMLHPMNVVVRGVADL